MKVVILAGGLPSTIADEREALPKPMVEIGERPLLWHIMKLYSFYGYNEFIICTGYKGDVIKRYFMDYYIYESDITIDLASNHITVHDRKTEDWSVTVLDTGMNATITERIKKAARYIDGDEFFISYGDCISDIHIADLFNFYKKSAKKLVVSVARPSGRNKMIPLNHEDELTVNNERSDDTFDAWVNACNMICSRDILANLDERTDLLQSDKMQELIADKQAAAYKHYGFWRAVETMRDRVDLESMWNLEHPPWKLWEESISHN